MLRIIDQRIERDTREPSGPIAEKRYSWTFRQLLRLSFADPEISHHAVKIWIHINADHRERPELSEAVVSVWTGKNWEEVHRLFPSQLVSHDDLCVREDVLASAFDREQDELLRVASEVLFNHDVR